VLLVVSVKLGLWNDEIFGAEVVQVGLVPGHAALALFHLEFLFLDVILDLDSFVNV
jgi:hypothetical protein